MAELRPLDFQILAIIDLANSVASSFRFGWIFVKLTDINKMDKISDEFENGSDRTNDGRVMSP